MVSSPAGPLRAEWESMMSSALLAAVDDSGADDVPIGAVVFDPGGIELARAGNRREADCDPTAHAEILALRTAASRFGDGWRLPGCTIVVTVEPCTMCAGAITLARVDTLVFGAWEPKTGAVGSLWDVVRDPRLTHRPQVVGGVREEEGRALMLDFFSARRTD
ncbi:nucleoside deaminase [Gordonia insulae]|uniref:tRNA-specific adenosine deaminase n=1 Tax=Gordonia insulae TaxID=2420509 RepID=A0A3G8JRD7_9ACTN|nr:nucleoside deaminase [Gordonia insulae]AZG46740.1 tRNA-specific adenosine deaminase [Gordonia insulae]